MINFNQLADNESVEKTKESLLRNGFNVVIVNTSEEARAELLKAIPEGSEVMENTSTTLDQIGVTKEIDESGKYISLHKQILGMDRNKEGKRIKEIRSTPDYAIGSFHAVTHDGHIMMASGSGSQIPGYAYGADHVVFVAGTHKIVKDVNMGLKRIYEHSLPLESERMNKAYDTTSGSNPRRILIINTERDPKRTSIIFVRQVLGF